MPASSTEPAKGRPQLPFFKKRNALPAYPAKKNGKKKATPPKDTQSVDTPAPQTPQPPSM
jgi:hypothetical protein